MKANIHSKQDWTVNVDIHVQVLHLLCNIISLPITGLGPWFIIQQVQSLTIMGTNIHNPICLGGCGVLMNTSHGNKFTMPSTTNPWMHSLVCQTLGKMRVRTNSHRELVPCCQQLGNVNCPLLEPPSVTHMNSMDCLHYTYFAGNYWSKKFQTKPRCEFDQTLVFQWSGMWD